MLHEKGYTFTPNGNISGLTRKEKSLLILGHMVSNEQQEEASRQAQSKRTHSKRKDTYAAAEEYVEKHNLRDKGYD